MKHGRKVYMGPYMASNGSYFMVTWTMFRNLGSLHTRAKSRDNEIVRAQKKVSNGVSQAPPKSCSVVTDPQV